MKETDEKLKSAMWKSSKDFLSKLWKPTNQLRWERLLLEIKDDSAMYTKELQQKWISNSGEEDWRTVPYEQE